MREILFKAKRLDNGEWVEGSLLQTTAVSLKSFIVESACYTFDEWDWNECVEVDTNTICQYTGLTDKNGNKIWENDVVQYDFGKYAFGVQNAVVQYSLEHKGYIINPVGKWPCYLVEFDEVEVIGNIFDNPELPKGGAE